jgi:DNA polymerase (family 10)
LRIRGELLYACKENRLVQYKGFGIKIQEDLIKSLEYFKSNQNSFLGSYALSEADRMEKILRAMNPQLKIRLVGELARAHEIVQKISWLIDQEIQMCPDELSIISKDQNEINGLWNGILPVQFIFYKEPLDAYVLLSHTGGSAAFYSYFELKPSHSTILDEREYFRSINKSYIPAECRDLDDFSLFKEEELIEEGDIKGVIS